MTIANRPPQGVVVHVFAARWRWPLVKAAAAADAWWRLQPEMTGCIHDMHMTTSCSSDDGQSAAQPKLPFKAVLQLLQCSRPRDSCYCLFWKGFIPRGNRTKHCTAGTAATVMTRITQKIQRVFTRVAQNSQKLKIPTRLTKFSLYGPKRYKITPGWYCALLLSFALTQEGI